MSKQWKRLSSMLHTAEGRDFERVALPFIRAIWSEAILPQPIRSTYDKSGIDILEWTGIDTLSITLAVQCKGFTVKEHELGRDQIRQCIESIKTFRESDIKADTYLLLHNRIPNNETFRSEVLREAEKLKESGQVKEVYVWGAQKLLQEAVKKVRARCIRIVQLNESKAQDFLIDPPLCSPLEKVPLQISEITVNPNRKIGESEIKEIIADPAEQLLLTDRSNLSLMLAQAGYGKTTSALRTLAVKSKRVFYLSAATLPRGVGNTDTLLKRWIRLDKLFEDVLEEDVPILERLSAPAIDYVLKDKETPVILILDALDESIYFSRPGGLQQLFNQLRDIRVPVILLARSEFWEGKQNDFANSYGIQSVTKDKLFNRKIKIIRLKDWQRDQIRALAQRYRDTQTEERRSNLDELVRIIDSGEYEDIYGDIPKRPLFLRFILDSVAEQGVKRKGKARLFYDWIELKIRRDVLNPIRFGGEGRIPILPNAEETQTTIRLAFKAMKIAAYKMALRSEQDNSLELLSSCDIEDVLLSDERLKAVLDPTGLFLHSLLIPTRVTPEKLEIGFAHRTYQEFFLALYIRDNPQQFGNINLPKAVEDQLNSIKDEDI
jgi:hypothetical protein